MLPALVVAACAASDGGPSPERVRHACEAYCGALDRCDDDVAAGPCAVACEEAFGGADDSDVAACIDHLFSFTGTCAEFRPWVDDSAACARAFAALPGADAGSTDAGPCAITACDASAFTYTCASSASSTDLTYCDGGRVRSAVIRYDNGRTVVCTLSCSGAGGSCSDGTGARCEF